MFFDLNPIKLLVLAVLALIVFGPDRLPAMAAQAGRLLREARKYLDGAKAELSDSLGPEFSNFDVADLNPKHFVRKHLVEEITGDGVITGAFTGARDSFNGVRDDFRNAGTNGTSGRARDGNPAHHSGTGLNGSAGVNGSAAQNGSAGLNGAAAADDAPASLATLPPPAGGLAAGERPPYDLEAT